MDIPMIDYEGHRIAARGFDQASFRAAIEQASVEKLAAERSPTQAGWRILRPDTRDEWVVGIYGCSCQPVEKYPPSPHRAIVLLRLAISAERRDVMAAREDGRHVPS